MATLPLPSPNADPDIEKGMFRPIARDEWRKFGNWLLVWIVLANVGFMAMWLIGAPPRYPEILAAGAIGLVVRRMPFWVKCATFLLMMVYSILAFVAGLFNLAISSLTHSLRFFLEINPSNSSEYLIAAALLVVQCGTAFRQMRKDQGFMELRLVVLAILVTFALAQTDRFMGSGMRGHYKRAADVDTPFVSGSQLSSFVPVVGAPKRNLMLVMVESLGEPVGNETMKRLLFARYNDPAIADRFEITTGDTVYYNSTTAAEIRELCGRWGDYYEVLEQADAGCLPARLAKEGYETRAYHSFAGAFFERSTWYPNIGFQRQEFAEDLFARGARECGGVFPGACDRDVPALLARDLKAANKPQFVYWLTVNSHLPVPPGMNLDVDNCAKVSPGLAADYPMICRQFALWDQLDKAIIKEVTADDFPPTDILLVGDHMPPYYDRHHRSQFAPDRVPWLLLKWKGESSPRSGIIADQGGDGDGTAG